MEYAGQTAGTWERPVRRARAGTAETGGTEAEPAALELSREPEVVTTSAPLLTWKLRWLHATDVVFGEGAVRRPGPVVSRRR